jgi:hypothetical protein
MVMDNLNKYIKKNNESDESKTKDDTENVEGIDILQDLIY